jgi:hypothetical protein
VEMVIAQIPEGVRFRGRKSHGVVVTTEPLRGLALPGRFALALRL